MLKRLKQMFLTFYYSQQYAYCRSNEYLASHRGEAVVAADWARRADGWYLEWWKSGRRLK